jgi:transposase
MDHIGMDVHKKESQLCILTEAGELIERRVRSEPERFAVVLGDRPRARILIEASTDSEWVARCLEALGHEVIVADPNFAPMYATRTRKVKTDRRDARALADACLLGAYRPAHRLSDPQRHVRGRLLVRDALVRTRTRSISLIRALLRQQGYRVPSGSAEAFLRRVRAVALPGRLLSTIAPLLAVMRHLNTQLAYADQVIEDVTAHDDRVQRLRTVPSVGPVTAAAFVATIDDVRRFRHAHQVEAYLGLVPRELSSGESQRRGHITKAGPPRMRWLLIQAAVSILRRRPPEAEALRAWALRIAAQRGKLIAVVALARRFGRHPLRAPPRWECVHPPPRSASRCRRPSPRVSVGPHRACTGLSQVRREGERECCLGRSPSAAAQMAPPSLERPSCAASRIARHDERE